MCFSPAWIESLLIWLVIVCAIIAFIRLVLPPLLAQLGAGGGIVGGALNIVLWAIIAIAVIYIFFALIMCVGGGSFPLFPHR